MSQQDVSTECKPSVVRVVKVLLQQSFQSLLCMYVTLLMKAKKLEENTRVGLSHKIFFFL